MKRNVSVLLSILVIICVAFSGCSQNELSNVDYSNNSNWAYVETDVENKSADVFFVCPTVFMGDENTFNMSMDDSATKENFVGATNMEKGIYDNDCRFFAPYYEQVGLNVYKLPENERESYLEMAYKDVSSAFSYYMKNYNNGRPIILAGFSQGADMCIRLLRNEFKSKKTQSLLVACYAIGCNITQEEIQEYPQLKFAMGEKDTGVIVSFNSEAENITQSLTIPKGTKTLAINPLNWKTDSTPADKSLNKGACFTDYDGKVTKEIKNLTGAYIDNTRGALKVTDVSPMDYPPVLDIFEDGIYHLYDYQFFYKNLQDNVKVRIDAYENNNK